MSLENSRKLAGTERTDLVNRVVNIRNINPEFDKDDLHQMLEDLGFARSDRTLDRLMKDIIDLGKKNPNLDQEIDYHRNDILYSQEVGLESRFLPLIRSTVSWYQYNFAMPSKGGFARTLTYRWLKWANYFLQSANIQDTGIEEIDVFVVAQLYMVRDLGKSIGRKDIAFNDLEAWLTARPWESDESGKRYKAMIDADVYSPLLKLAGHSDPNVTIEKVGISFIADAYMHLCSIDQVKDLPESETWKLPHQQRQIFIDWCKDNDKEPIITIQIPNIEQPINIKFE